MAGRRRPVVWSWKARQDLDDILDFLADDSVAGARQVGERILKAVEGIDPYPLRGRVVPEIGDPSIRERILRPWRIVYLVRHDCVVVLAVLHGAREFERRRRT